jgi:hypothetical protein
MRELIVLAAFAASVVAQSEQPDLVGTLSFDVGSDSGRVERLAVQIGDGGSGPYKAILAGEPSLPTHAIYRPRDLKVFGGERLLPIVAFGNGGCRNGSGEFRNFLSDIASHGYLVIAIGPAGNAVVAGSEGRTGQTQASQLLDGVDWATRENSRQGSEYFGKIDLSKVAVMGQSCGSGQVLQVSGDPRITTTILLNGGPRIGTSRAPVAEPAKPATQAAGADGNTNAPANDMFAALDKMERRYAPYAPVVPRTMGSTPPEDRAKYLKDLHGPVALINGGPSDLAYNGAVAGYEAIQNVPALLAWQDVGHYPATFRQPNGGAFAVAVNAWLDWQLKGDQSASEMFVGSSCGLCTDPKWTVKFKDPSGR